MFYGSNLYRKDNPRWIISNATETPKVSDAWEYLVADLGSGDLAAGLAGRVRNLCGTCVAWFIGLPRRAGARLHAANDAEARWWHWQVTERRGGLVRWYRDSRFQVLAHDPAIRREELSAELAATDHTPPECPGNGDL